LFKKEAFISFAKVVIFCKKEPVVFADLWCVESGYTDGPQMKTVENLA
jgi:hypothetical protein